MALRPRVGARLARERHPGALGGCGVTGRTAERRALFAAENLERLDNEAIRGARQSLDIAMYSFTDILLAEAVREAGRRGVRVRIYRDGEEYEREQAQSRSHRSATQALRGDANIRVRVKPPSRDYMHLKQLCVDGRLLRTGSANGFPSGEKQQDNECRLQH